MGVWRERMRAHAGAACRHLIVNERREGGASLPHTHAQLYALDFVPAAIARERERFGAYATRTMGGNLLADLVQHEVRQRVRLVAYDDEAVVHGAVRVAHRRSSSCSSRGTRVRDSRTTARSAPRCCTTRCTRLQRRFGCSPPLNLWVRTAPSGAEHFCWRIDIVPRLTHLAGLELGTGVHLNIVAPGAGRGRAARRVIVAVVVAIVASIWAGVRAERRYGESAQRGVQRAVRIALWGLIPPIVIVITARLEFSSGVGVGIVYGYLVIAHRRPARLAYRLAGAAPPACLDRRAHRHVDPGEHGVPRHPPDPRPAGRRPGRLRDRLGQPHPLPDGVRRSRSRSARRSATTARATSARAS